MLLRHAFLVAFIVGFPLSVQAVSPNLPPHLDRQKLNYGCGSCHVGFNFKSGGGTTGCTSCHGNTPRLANGLVATGSELKDVESEFKKIYRHPTFDVRSVHSSKEELPETDPKMPRHADCVDCHDPHLVSSANPFAGIKGKRMGNIMADISHEYELCYRCHAESANLPGRFSNKRAEFSVNNPSFHPVEGEGRNSAVISLLKPFREKKINPSDVSVIKCGDCHGSESPSSPKGPHGSNYPSILVENYSARDNEPESVYAYALCYRCHNRASILADESFKFHSLHIKGKSGSAIGATSGTSCHTCHNSHGSTENKYLLQFNPEVVTPNSRGMLKFVEKGVSSFRGECYLSCHGVDHNPKVY